MTFNFSTPCQCIIIFQPARKEGKSCFMKIIHLKAKKLKAINYSWMYRRIWMQWFFIFFLFHLSLATTFFNPPTISNYFRCSREPEPAEREKKLQLGNENTRCEYEIPCLGSRTTLASWHILLTSPLHKRFFYVISHRYSSILNVAKLSRLSRFTPSRH